MATASVPEPPPDVYQQLGPDQLETRIGFLIWRYQVSPSSLKAHTIVRHLEALCRHPDLERFAISRFQYERAALAWRLISDRPCGMAEA